MSKHRSRVDEEIGEVIEDSVNGFLERVKVDGKPTVRLRHGGGQNVWHAIQMAMLRAGWELREK